MKSYDSKFNPDLFDARFSGWINVNPKGGSNVLHSHPNSHWSGVLYIQQPTEADSNQDRITIAFNSLLLKKKKS